MNTAMREAEAQKLKQDARLADAFQLRLEIERDHEHDPNSSVIDRARNLNFLTSLALSINKMDEAERAARKCYSIYYSAASLFGESRNMSLDNEKLATYCMMLALVLAERGKFEEGAQLGELAVNLFASLPGMNTESIRCRQTELSRVRRREPGHYVERIATKPS